MIQVVLNDDSGSTECLPTEWWFR